MATPERHLLAVFRDTQTARAAADAAVEAGVSRSAVRVGSPDDEVRALRAEMREEMSHTWIGAGNVGPFTKEMHKGLSVGAALGAVVGALLGTLAALVFMSDFDVPTRILVGAGIGGFGGAVLGFVAGGGFGAKGPAEPLAAEEGVTVTVRTSERRVEDALRRFDPIRVDVLDAEDHPVGTLSSEDGDSVGEVAGGIARKLTDEPEGDSTEWSDRSRQG